jgi:hypothetical protein
MLLMAHILQVVLLKSSTRKYHNTLHTVDVWVQTHIAL